MSEREEGRTGVDSAEPIGDRDENRCPFSDAIDETEDMGRVFTAEERDSVLSAWSLPSGMGRGEQQQQKQRWNAMIRRQARRRRKPTGQPTESERSQTAMRYPLHTARRSDVAMHSKAQQ